ncbi:hypothetical protein [Ruminiclostridium sufflavum]|nr:hypothetical protein [Ruminiclostridium sufflavum]
MKKTDIFNFGEGFEHVKGIFYKGKYYKNLGYEYSDNEKTVNVRI